MSTTWTSSGFDAKRQARESNHRQGLPWTDPATGRTYLPPAPPKAKRPKRKSAKKSKARRR